MRIPFKWNKRQFTYYSNICVCCFEVRLFFFMVISRVFKFVSSCLLFTQWTNQKAQTIVHNKQLSKLVKINGKRQSKKLISSWPSDFKHTLSLLLFETVTHLPVNDFVICKSLSICLRNCASPTKRNLNILTLLSYQRCFWRKKQSNKTNQ